MNRLKKLATLFCVMFTVIATTYYIFNIVIKDERIYTIVISQVLGLAVIFTLILEGLDILSNSIKWLNGKTFILVQYLLMLVAIVFWASNFQWGNWQSKGYVFTFILSFTIIYVFICFMLESKNKKEDKALKNYLNSYQNKSRI